MKKLILKSCFYIFLILISLELIIRVFYLTKDYPNRYIDKYKVEKWKPNQEGYSVTGNRRQNFSKYHINSSGYNSYREFTPSHDKVELALVGDSFIQGFHQNYYNSIGAKIENMLGNIEVYEYGYAGYDFADELHLVHAYKNKFDKIDFVVLGIKFENDLFRDQYNVDYSRMDLETGWFKKARASKLLVYLQSIGLTEPLWKLTANIISIAKGNLKKTSIINSYKSVDPEFKYLSYIDNFESLIIKYGYDKSRFTLLLDSGITPKIFLDYLEKNNFKYIDFHAALSNSKDPTTLIYDRHWNNHGRKMIAELIVKFYKKQQK